MYWGITASNNKYTQISTRKNRNIYMYALSLGRYEIFWNISIFVIDFHEIEYQ